MKNTKGDVCPVKKLKLSINGREGRIRIGWGVADILHDSEFLCIYMSQENDSIMVKPCEEKEFLSIKIGNRREGNASKDLLIYSLAFVTSLMEQQGWDLNKTYHMLGEYFEEYNAVLFNLKKAVAST